ncbi:MAG: TonB-dependent receptor, partial [Acidobacteria bacterium]
MFVMALCLAVFATGAMAQKDTGQISGKVTDPNGAVVQNATITVRSIDTGTEVTAASGSDGNYTVTNLKPGVYDVIVKAAGYADNTQRVQVTVGSNTTVTTGMAIQAVTAGVNVTIVAEAGIAVNTQNQEVSNVVSSTQLRELPSLTRNPYDFVALSGG